jgi:hypothetical protein
MEGSAHPKAGVATILSVLAVAIALTGGGVALASHLEVRSSDIVDGQVKTADLDANAATGAKVKESSFSTVPNAAAVDGISGDTFTRHDVGEVAAAPLLDLGGLQVSMACTISPVLGQFTPQLDVHTTTDDARIQIGLTTGQVGSGDAFTAFDLDFDTGEVFTLDRDRPNGTGTLLYSKASGRTVTLNYSFNGDMTSCYANGVAFGD